MSLCFMNKLFLHFYVINYVFLYIISRALYILLNMCILFVLYFINLKLVAMSLNNNAIYLRTAIAQFNNNII